MKITTEDFRLTLSGLADRVTVASAFILDEPIAEDLPLDIVPDVEVSSPLIKISDEEIDISGTLRLFCDCILSDIKVLAYNPDYAEFQFDYNGFPHLLRLLFND